MVRCPPPSPFFPLAPLLHSCWADSALLSDLTSLALSSSAPRGWVLSAQRAASWAWAEGPPNGLCGRWALWVLKVVSSTLDLHCYAQGTFPKPKSYDPVVCKRLRLMLQENPASSLHRAWEKQRRETRADKERENKLPRAGWGGGSEQHGAQRRSVGKDDCPSRLHSW